MGFVSTINDARVYQRVKDDTKLYRRVLIFNKFNWLKNNMTLFLMFNYYLGTVNTVLYHIEPVDTNLYH